jgi:hypothetical protein
MSPCPHPKPLMGGWEGSSRGGRGALRSPGSHLELTHFIHGVIVELPESGNTWQRRNCLSLSMKITAVMIVKVTR